MSNNQIKFDNKSKHNTSSKKNLVWWFGIVVLILISITFILPAAIFTPNKNINGLVFGRWNKKDINVAYKSDMANAVQLLTQLYSAMYGSSNSEFYNYSIWRGAFEDTAVKYAATELFNKAKGEVTNEAVDNQIIKLYLTGDNGKVDYKNWTNLPESRKNDLKDQIKSNYPRQIVLSDIRSPKDSKILIDMIKEKVGAGKKFTFVEYSDFDLGKNDLNKTFEANKDKFYKNSFKVLEFDDIKKAEGVKASDFETEEASDQRNVYANDITDLKDDKTLSPLFKLKKDELSQVIETKNGKFRVYKALSNATAPSLKDINIADEMKNIFKKENPKEVQKLIASNFSKFSPKTDNFSKYFADKGVNTLTVSQAYLNGGEFSLFPSLGASETGRKLEKVFEANTEVKNKAWNSKASQIVGPVSYGDSVYLILSENVEKVDDKKIEDALLNAKLTDFNSSVLASPKLKDNFMATYFSEVVKPSQSAKSSVEASDSLDGMTFSIE